MKRLWVGVGLCVSALAQSDQVRISGKAVDSSGAPIENTAITLKASRTGQTTAKSVTGVDGAFVFTAVDPATYDVSFEALMFKPVMVKSIQIDRADVQMQPVKMDVDLNAAICILTITASDTSRSAGTKASKKKR
jgi:hypothetical protein